MSTKHYITVQVRVHWTTPDDIDKETCEVYDAVYGRIERCLAVNVCGQVGAIPGTEKMELLYGTVI